MDFPTIQYPVYPLKENIPDHTWKGETDNETILTRPRFTKVKHSFTLTWDALPIADLVTLHSFYLNQARQGALAFNWTYPPEPGSPYAGTVFAMRFDGDWEMSLSDPGHYSGSIKLTEA